MGGKAKDKCKVQIIVVEWMYFHAADAVFPLIRGVVEQEVELDNKERQFSVTLAPFPAASLDPPKRMVLAIVICGKVSSEIATIESN